MDYEKTLETVKQMVKDGQVSQETAELYFPELKESKDERIRKWIINEIKIKHHNLDEDNVDFVDKAIAWLEKQGKQKSDFFCGEHCKEFQDTGKCFADGDCKAKREAESIDKVEPKFHEGDWIATSYGKVNQVITVDKDGDGYTLDDGVYFTGCWCDMYHLWDITKDAKDGDVLASDNSIFIFREEYIAEKPIAYCGLMNGLFIEGENACWTNENCNPATKEQRDTLMKAMADAGWKFDFEKKELKKISQRIVSAEAKEAMYDKPTWSEEDETVLNNLIYALANDRIGNNRDEYVDWLKSLRPQHRWKPSDEQLEALRIAAEIGTANNSWAMDILKCIYQYLKKLREE